MFSTKMHLKVFVVIIPKERLAKDGPLGLAYWYWPIFTHIGKTDLRRVKNARKIGGNPPIGGTNIACPATNSSFGMTKDKDLI